MGLFKHLFGKKPTKLLLETIQHNAEMIEKDEGRTRADAEYLAICLVLDDLATRPNGQEGHKLVMDLLANEYSQHRNDVLLYLTVKAGQVHLKPEVEEALRKRHEKK